MRLENVHVKKSLVTNYMRAVSEADGAKARFQWAKTKRTQGWIHQM